MVAVAILVVDDGNETSVVRHSGEKEVVPCGWDMRTDGDFCRHGWTQSAQSGNDEVAIRGMIIIAGTLSVAHQPLSVFLVKVFSYVLAAHDDTATRCISSDDGKTWCLAMPRQVVANCHRHWQGL